MPKKINFEEFKKKALAYADELMTVLTVDPLSIRLAYFIYRNNLSITPNQISFFRMLFLGPAIIVCLFLAPILQLKIFYLFSAILMYFFMFSDALDGHLARGSGKTSEFGAFLDSISDRVQIILTFTFFLSLGIFLKNLFIIYGSIFLFIIKAFNLTVIAKIFYYGKKDMDMEEIFSANKELSTLGLEKGEMTFKLHKFFKIKRWGSNLRAYERVILIVIIPSLLVFFNLAFISMYELYLLIVLFSYFYISRTKNLIWDYKKLLEKNKYQNMNHG